MSGSKAANGPRCWPLNHTVTALNNSVASPTAPGPMRHPSMASRGHGSERAARPSDSVLGRHREGGDADQHGGRQSDSAFDPPAAACTRPPVHEGRCRQQRGGDNEFADDLGRPPKHRDLDEVAAEHVVMDRGCGHGRQWRRHQRHPACQGEQPTPVEVHEARAPGGAESQAGAQSDFAKRDGRVGQRLDDLHAVREFSGRMRDEPCGKDRWPAPFRDRQQHAQCQSAGRPEHGDLFRLDDKLKTQPDGAEIRCRQDGQRQPPGGSSENQRACHAGDLGT